MSMNSIETSVSAPPSIIPQQRYGNNNLINLKPIPIQRSGVLKIRELRPWIRGFDITCIILKHLSRRTLKTQQEVELHSFLVADETAVCTLVIWENGQYYQGGDIVQITHGETRVHEESLELTVNKNFGKIKIIDWDTMYYKEDEEPNLSGYTWVQDEKSPNTYVPMNHEKKYIDLETFKPYERPPQPYVIDPTPSSGFPSNIIKQEISIKQEESTKMIKHEEDGIHGGMQYSRERGPPSHPSRYGSNGGGIQEHFGYQHDNRSQQSLQSRQQIPPQQGDRPRLPQRRPSKFQRRDSWRDQERGGDGGGGRPDRDNGRPRNQEINKRAGGGRNQPRSRGRDWDRSRDNRDRDRDREREWDFNRPPHTDLDRPPEEGESVNSFDFGSIAAGLNRSDNREPKDMREGIPHKKPRLE